MDPISSFLQVCINFLFGLLELIITFLIQVLAFVLDFARTLVNTVR